MKTIKWKGNEMSLISEFSNEVSGNLLFAEKREYGFSILTLDYFYYKSSGECQVETNKTTLCNHHIRTLMELQ